MAVLAVLMLQKVCNEKLRYRVIAQRFNVN